MLFVIPSLRTGGLERDVTMYCRFADPQRIVPQLLTYLPGGELYDDVVSSGTVVRCLERRRAYDPLFALRLARTIAQTDVDIVHALTPQCAFYSALARRLFSSLESARIYRGDIGDTDRGGTTPAAIYLAAVRAVYRQFPRFARHLARSRCAPITYPRGPQRTRSFAVCSRAKRSTDRPCVAAWASALGKPCS